MLLKKRLGLDLGTQSIGWCLLEFEEGGDRYTIVDLGVRLWSNDASKADRRTFRASMRQRRYRRSRLQELDRILEGHLDSQPKSERVKMRPFELRVKALDEALEPHELRAVLFHLAKNRGFHGSGEEAELHEKQQKGFKNTISQTESRVGEEARTYAEWLVKTNRPKFRLRGDEKPDHYPTRSLITAEFDKIRAFQEPYFPTLDWAGVREVIFYQRELLPPIIGRCAVYPEEKRMLKNESSAKEFVMIQTLSHMTLKSLRTGEIRKLTRAEIREAAIFCKTQKTMKYTKLLKLLKLHEEFEIAYKTEDKEKPEVPGLQNSFLGYLHLSKRAVDEILEEF